MSIEESSRGRVVWLVNKGGHDYSDLDRFGRVMPMTAATVNPFNPDRLMLGLANHIKMARPEDYLAISGMPIINALAIALWLRRFPEVHILQHSTRQGKYIYLRVTNAAIDQNLSEGD